MKKTDLNWENPELREEIYTMINWWLDNRTFLQNDH